MSRISNLACCANAASTPPQAFSEMVDNGDGTFTHTNGAGDEFLWPILCDCKTEFTIGMCAGADFFIAPSAGNILGQYQSALDTINALILDGTCRGAILRHYPNQFDFDGQVARVNEHSNIIFRGAGIDSTEIFQGGIVKNSTNITRNIGIEDMTINVNGVPNMNAVNFVNQSYDFWINRVKMMNTSNRFLLHWGIMDNFRCSNSIFLDGGLDVGADNAAGSQMTTTDKSSVFENNYFLKTSASAGGGLLTTGQTGNLIIKGNTFENDKAGRSYAGVSIENQGGNSKNVTVSDNHFLRVGMLFGTSNIQNTIDEVIVSDNTMTGVSGDFDRGGIALNRVAKARVHHNHMRDTNYGIWIRGSGRVGVDHNQINSTDVGLTNAADRSAIDLIDNDYVKVMSNELFNDSGNSPAAIRLRTTPTGRAYVDHNTADGFATSLNVLTGTNFLKLADNDWGGGATNEANAATLADHNNIA